MHVHASDINPAVYLLLYVISSLVVTCIIYDLVFQSTDICTLVPVYLLVKFCCRKFKTKENHTILMYKPLQSD